jgi:hypothetical protein
MHFSKSGLHTGENAGDAHSGCWYLSGKPLNCHDIYHGLPDEQSELYTDRQRSAM